MKTGHSHGITEADSNDEVQVPNNLKKSRYVSNVIHIAPTIHCVIHSIHGLASVPAAYSAIKQELGLVNPVWSSHPAEWKRLCTLWLCVEGSLGKTGRPDLTNQEINNLAVPPDIVNWMLRKKLSQEHPQPDGGFDKVWTTFLSRLAISDREKTSDILQEMWCRPGHTGIVFLLLGMHWQAEYFGTGKDWHRNVKCVEHIFNIIISHPSLYVFNLLIRHVS